MKLYFFEFKFIIIRALGFYKTQCLEDLDSRSFHEIITFLPLTIQKPNTRIEKLQSFKHKKIPFKFL